MTLFPRRIVLAIDGSEEAELAARTSVGLAGGIDAELHVVYVELLPEFMKNGDGRQRSLLGSLLARFEASKKVGARR